MLQNYLSILTRKQKSIFFAFTFITISIIVFFPTLFGKPFWDDWVFIFRNEYFYNQSILSYFPGGSQSRSWPIFYSSMWILLKIFKSKYFLYHLLSLVTHGLNGFLIWKILNRFKIGNSFLAATLYLIHPFNIFTVAWIIQFKTLLSLFFFLNFLLFILKYRDEKNIIYLPISTLFFGFSILTKSTTAAIILLVPFVFRRNVFFHWKNKILILFIALVVTISTYALIRTTWSYNFKSNLNEFISDNIQPIKNNIIKEVETPRRTEDTSFVATDKLTVLDKTFFTLKTFLRYLLFLLLPLENYLFQPSVHLTLNSLEFILIFVGISLIIYHLSFLKTHNYKFEKYCFLYFILSLIPFCGFIYIPIFSYSNFIPYWLTIPAIGLVPSLARVIKNKKYFLMIIIFYASLSHYQSYNFINVENLFITPIERSPNEKMFKVALLEQYLNLGKCSDAKKIFSMFNENDQKVETALITKIERCK